MPTSQRADRHSERFQTCKWVGAWRWLAELLKLPVKLLFLSRWSEMTGHTGLDCRGDSRCLASVPRITCLDVTLGRSGGQWSQMSCTSVPVCPISAPIANAVWLGVPVFGTPSLLLACSWPSSHSCFFFFCSRMETRPHFGDQTPLWGPGFKFLLLLWLLLLYFSSSLSWGW